MNERLKWFGIYLGCNMSHTLYPEILIEATLGKINTFQKDIKRGRIKLVLKELKDITSDEIIHLLNRTVHIHGLTTFDKINTDDYGVFLKLHYSSQNTEYHCREIYLSVRDMMSSDFLRSKGYAVGIPKKYYITEDELK